jgi:hypothetical protein
MILIPDKKSMLSSVYHAFLFENTGHIHNYRSIFCAINLAGWHQKKAADGAGITAHYEIQRQQWVPMLLAKPTNGKFLRLCSAVAKNKLTGLYQSSIGSEVEVGWIMTVRGHSIGSGRLGMRS